CKSTEFNEETTIYSKVIHTLTNGKFKLPKERIEILYIRSFSTIIWSLNYATGAEVIRVGLLFVDNVTELEPAIGYRFSILFDECNEQLAAGGTFQLINEHHVNVIIGPTCSDLIDNVNRFPTTGVLSVNSFSLGIAVRSILLAFEWDQFALLYSNVGDYDSSCKAMKNDLQNVVNRFDDLTINFVTDVMEMTLDYVKKVMHYTAERARIVVVCVDDEIKREFILYLKDAGYLRDDFIYIFADSDSDGFYVRNSDGQEHYVWQDLKNTTDGRDEEAKDAFTYVFSITSHRGAAGNKEKYNQFGEEVIRRMKDPPFSCTTQCSGKEYHGTVSAYAGQLHDAFYAYAVAANRTLTSHSQLGDGRSVANHYAMEFEGVSGRIVLGPNGTRYPTFYFDALNAHDQVETYATVFVEKFTGTYTPLYKNESVVWWGRGGRPPAVPECGFKGLQCPVDFVKEYKGWIGGAGVIFSATIVGIIIGIVYFIRVKKREEERLNKMWQIPFTALEPIEKKKTESSFYSTQSRPSTASSLRRGGKSETRNFIFFCHD
ncbi:ligand-binding protein, receptor family, partial [Ostertagia ostertagi]